MPRYTGRQFLACVPQHQYREYDQESLTPSRHLSLAIIPASRISSISEMRQARFCSVSTILKTIGWSFRIR